MPQPPNLAKAQLVEVWPGADNKLEPRGKDGGPGKTVPVQFNPQSLKVVFANQNAGGDQPGRNSVQFVGKGTTKLSVELWFDVTLPHGNDPGDPQGDVRNLTKEIAYFMMPQEVTVGRQRGLLPAGVRFLWGSFLFEGVMDSMDETIEFFSEDGRPLRAGVNISLSKQEFQFAFNPEFQGPGAQPMAAARSGDSLQQMAAQAGNPDWKSTALANGIENPRQLGAGALVNLSAGVSAGVSGGFGVSGGAGIGATGGAGFGVSSGAGIGVSGGAGFGVSGGGGPAVSGGAGGGIVAAAGLRASGQASAAAPASGRKLGFVSFSAQKRF